MINELKSLVSEFQSQTRSSDVLAFIVWVENRIELLKKIGNTRPEALAQKIVDELNKPKKDIKI